jgi:hypothetical protein
MMMTYHHCGTMTETLMLGSSVLKYNAMQSKPMKNDYTDTFNAYLYHRYTYKEWQQVTIYLISGVSLAFPVTSASYVT